MTRTDALVGIDLGQTRTKAVVFDLAGRQLGLALDSTEADHPRPRWAERDLDDLWRRTSAVLRAALEAAGSAVEVLAVGVSGHSDGLYLVDAAARPVRPAILATDARAGRQAAALAEGDRGERLLGLTGQLPMAAAPSALLRWLRDHEPASLRGSRWILSSTDWLRLQLTGTPATDVTMASAGFVALGEQTWSEEALDLCDLAELSALLPPVLPSHEVAGRVTPEAAGQTGLRAGTVVVTGAHDVDTGSLGMGSLRDTATVLLGTYSINQVLREQPVPDPRWQVRPFLGEHQWLHMSTSPAGAGCLDWAVSRIGPRNAAGGADTAAAVAEAGSTPASMASPYFLPFVHGGPPGSPVGGSWAGLRSEHGRAAMLRAVMEGIAFSHRHHLEALRSRMTVPTPLRVGGGGARSHGWTQLLSDVLGTDLEVTRSEEVSALGAALLAGVGVGAYRDLDHAVADAVRPGRTHRPDARRRQLLDARYARYAELAHALGSVELGPFEEADCGVPPQ